MPICLKNAGQVPLPHGPAPRGLRPRRPQECGRGTLRACATSGSQNVQTPGAGCGQNFPPYGAKSMRIILRWLSYKIGGHLPRRYPIRRCLRVRRYST